ncbi:M15 family metallopeptidase [Marinomonas sp. THO17]|uniref:M15 family metallopeptidase n=1 Tax=Marinomonas sp. THO17 TaxID=3149048 RepID=UPI00336BF4B0
MYLVSPVELSKLVLKVGLYVIFFIPLFSIAANTPSAGGNRYFSLSSAYCKSLETAGVITNANPVPCTRLKKVLFRYVNAQGQIMDDGQFVVLDLLAPKVALLMNELLKQEFVIYQAKPIEFYGGNDHASMRENNSSAFNGRAVFGGKRWSLHAYGAAIDINPVQNPFIRIEADGSAQIYPQESAYYAVNRLQYRPGKAARLGMSEEVVERFAEHGFFIWGGDWNAPIDYQHFQVGPYSFVETLLKMTPSEGQRVLDEHIEKYSQCMAQGMNSIIAKPSLRATCIENLFR